MLGGRERKAERFCEKKKKLFHIHSFSNEKKVQRVLKKYPCFFLFVFVRRRKKNSSYFENLVVLV